MLQLPQIKRQSVVQLVTVFLLATIIAISWDLVGPIKNKDHEVTSQHASESQASNNASFETNALESFNLKIYTIETKFIVGSLQIFDEQKQRVPKELPNAMRNSIVSSVKFNIETALTTKDTEEMPISMLRRMFITARYFELYDVANNLMEMIKAESTDNDKLSNINLLLETLNTNTPTYRYSDDDCELLSKSLSWFGDIAISIGATNPVIREQHEKIFKNQASKTAKFLILGILCSGVLIIVSFISSLFFISRLRKGQIKSNYRDNNETSKMPADLCLEIFCLYLTGMLLMPILLHGIADALSISAFYLNVPFILSLLIVILWPQRYGIAFLDIRQTLGLRIRSVKSFFVELFIGSYIYVTSIFSFIIIMAIYALVLSALEVDASQGTHPVTALLLESNDISMIICIFVLAVIVAPLVEETMFRGALYVWLRNKIKTPYAIALSSLIFAAIHPQGPVGIFPLLLIGCILASIREWRGNLVAPMMAHACLNAGTLLLVMLLR